MRIRLIAAAAVLFFLAVAPPALSFNELDNSCFVYQGEGWEFTATVQFNGNGTDPGGDPVFGRGHIAYDPWPIPGAAGSIRQVVDNTKSPDWDPTLNDKIADLWFDVYTTGEAYVVVGFDWWDTYWGDTKPVGPAPYEELLPIQFTSPDQWTRFHVTYDWLGKPGETWQPRWISIEFGFFGCSGTGYEAAVDDVVLETRCVPEPAGLGALATGLMALGGFAARRRRP